MSVNVNNPTLDAGIKISEETREYLLMLQQMNAENGISTTNSSIMQAVYIAGIAIMFIFLFMLSAFIRKTVIEKMNEIINLLREPKIKSFAHYADLSVKFTTELINRDVNKKINRNNIVRNFDVIIKEINTAIDLHVEDGRKRLKEKFDEKMLVGFFHNTTTMVITAKNDIQKYFEKARDKLEITYASEVQLIDSYENKSNCNMYKFFQELEKIKSDKHEIYDELRRDVYDVLMTIQNKVSDSLA